MGSVLDNLILLDLWSMIQTNSKTRRMVSSIILELILICDFKFLGLTAFASFSNRFLYFISIMQSRDPHHLTNAH